ncbi:MAG TPA: hypothetical protein VEG40_11860 [Gaiellaceae bacterium]|nr:hypothetical protein [Gaiellaceae bacterium]
MTRGTSRQGGLALGAVLTMHVVFGFVWFVVWFVWAYFTSFAGDATTVFLLAFLTWFLAAGIVVW